MRRREFKGQLKRALRDFDIPVEKERLELTKSLIKNEPRRNIGRERIGFGAFLLTQIRFIGWKIWAAQGIMLAVINCFLTASMGEYFKDNPRYVALLLCYLSVLVLMSALPFICRALRYKMYETEAAARFSSVKLLTAKLLIIGIGDISMLGCILYFAVLKTPLSAGSAILYLLFPFLLASCGLLFTVGSIPASKYAAGSVGICAFLFTAFSLLSEIYPAFYRQSFSIGWAAVCLILAFVCAARFRYIVCRGSYAETQLV